MMTSSDTLVGFKNSQHRSELLEIKLFVTKRWFRYCPCAPSKSISDVLLHQHSLSGMFIYEKHLDDFPFRWGTITHPRSNVNIDFIKPVLQFRKSFELFIGHHQNKKINTARLQYIYIYIRYISTKITIANKRLATNKELFVFCITSNSKSRAIVYIVNVLLNSSRQLTCHN